MTKVEALKLALEALENNRQTHHYCEDTWYSCPKHEDGCANDSEGDECNCGADKANAEIDKAITAIKEALAQPEQEPVVWMYVNKSSHEVRFQKHMRDFVDHGAFSEVPLFSEPLANQEKTSGSPIAQRKPLTDEEIGDIAALYYPRWQGHEGFARAIEAKLKEKNNG